MLNKKFKEELQINVKELMESDLGIEVDCGHCEETYSFGFPRTLLANNDAHLRLWAIATANGFIPQGELFNESNNRIYLITQIA